MYCTRRFSTLKKILFSLSLSLCTSWNKHALEKETVPPSGTKERFPRKIETNLSHSRRQGTRHPRGRNPLPHFGTGIPRSRLESILGELHGGIRALFPSLPLGPCVWPGAALSICNSDTLRGAAIEAIGTRPRWNLSAVWRRRKVPRVAVALEYQTIPGNRFAFLSSSISSSSCRGPRTETSPCLRVFGRDTEEGDVESPWPGLRGR